MLYCRNPQRECFMDLKHPHPPGCDMSRGGIPKVMRHHLQGHNMLWSQRRLQDIGKSTKTQHQPHLGTIPASQMLLVASLSSDIKWAIYLECWTAAGLVLNGGPDTCLPKSTGNTASVYIWKAIFKTATEAMLKNYFKKIFLSNR